jgi:hypothetical protein
MIPEMRGSLLAVRLEPGMIIGLVIVGLLSFMKLPLDVLKCDWIYLCGKRFLMVVDARNELF